MLLCGQLKLVKKGIIILSYLIIVYTTQTIRELCSGVVGIKRAQGIRSRLIRKLPSFSDVDWLVLRSHQL